MNNNMVSNIRVGMCTTNIDLLQFKIQKSLTKTRTLELISEKPSKISNITFTITKLLS